MPQSLSRLFSGKIPSVRDFNREIDALPLDEKRERLYPIFRIAFTSWSVLNGKCRMFIKRVIEHDRQIWLDYVLERTVIGALRYHVQFPDALLKAVKIVEYENRRGKISLNHLSMGILMVFDYNYRLSTMGDYLRRVKVDVEDGLRFLGVVRIEGVLQN